MAKLHKRGPTVHSFPIGVVPTRPVGAPDDRAARERPTVDELTELPKAELQRRARLAGLPVSGTKAELAERIAADDAQ